MASIVAAVLAAGGSPFEATVLANLAAGVTIRHIGCYAVMPDELHDVVNASDDYLRAVGG